MHYPSRRQTAAPTTRGSISATSIRPISARSLRVIHATIEGNITTNPLLTTPCSHHVPSVPGEESDIRRRALAQRPGRRDAASTSSVRHRRQCAPAYARHELCRSEHVPEHEHEHAAQHEHEHEHDHKHVTRRGGKHGGCNHDRNGIHDEPVRANILCRAHESTRVCRTVLRSKCDGHGIGGASGEPTSASELFVRVRCSRADVV